VREVDRYQLDMVGLTSMHSTDSGTKLLERGWTLSFSGVVQGVRRQAGVGILTSPRLSAAVLEFSPVNERVALFSVNTINSVDILICSLQFVIFVLFCCTFRWALPLFHFTAHPVCVCDN